MPAGLIVRIHCACGLDCEKFLQEVIVACGLIFDY